MDSPEGGGVRRPLLLTGGPAVGKTTCGRALAKDVARGAYIDVDDVRQLVVAGAEPLWAGPEGQAQHMLGASNASALAANFLAAAFDVTIADVLTPATARIYRDLLPGCLIVHLRISLAGARRRAATRTVHLTDAEFEMLHRNDVADPPEADVVFHVEGMSVDEQVDQLRRLWDKSSEKPSVSDPPTGTEHATKAEPSETG